MGKFVSGNYHRGSKGKHQRRQHSLGPHKTVFQNNRIVRVAFGSGIPAPVGIISVAIVFAIAGIVFMIMADEVPQIKTVMSGDKVYAGPDITVVIIKNIAGAGQTAGHFGSLKLVAFPETSDVITVFVIPFGPAGEKGTDLISAKADIPRFGYHFALAATRGPELPRT